MFVSLKSSLTKSQKSHPVSSEDSRMTRKVRVIFQDPYATDSSSSEDEGESSHCVEKIRKRRSIVREINLPAPPALVAPVLAQAKSIQSETSSQDSNSRPGSNRKRVLAKTPDNTPKKAKSNKPVGIRQRKWGKWAAEIKHPITRKRIWIGTYNTLEEATAAYNAKKVEFAAAAAAAAAASGKSSNVAAAAAATSDKASNVTSSAAASQNNPAASGPEESDSVLSHTSPSSVLDLDTSASAPTSKNNYNIVDPIAEGLDINFDDLPMDFGFADAPLFPGSAEQDLNFNFEFDDLMFANDLGTFLDGFCGIDDLNVSGIQGDEPSELPDYDFSTDDFLVADAPFNIACP